MKMTIRSDGFDGWVKRSRIRAEKMSKGERIKPEFIVNFASPADMLKVLTVERIRLYQKARERAYTISALASALERDLRSVRRDISKLEEAGVLKTRIEVNAGHGRVKIVTPLAMRIELRTSF